MKKIVMLLLIIGICSITFGASAEGIIKQFKYTTNVNATSLAIDLRKDDGIISTWLFDVPGTISADLYKNYYALLLTAYANGSRVEFSGNVVGGNNLVVTVRVWNP